MVHARNAGSQAGTITLTPNNKYVGTAITTVAVSADGEAQHGVSLRDRVSSGGA